MSLADLTNKITADAQQQASSIAKAAMVKVAAIEKSHEVERSETEKTFTDETSHILEDNTSRLQSSAQQEGKMLVEKAKRVALDAVFTDAITKITKLSDSDYHTLLIGMIADSLPKSISGKAFCPRNRKSVTASILKSFTFEGDISETDDILTGFTIVSDSFEYNFTFEKTLSDKRQELEIEIASLLFAS